MKLPNPAVVDKVKQWLAYADEDLRFARHGFSLSDSPPHHLIAYHAQQSAEKCLKAYLIFHVIDFPYTHDIAHLLELCSGHGSWAGELRDAEALTPYAITARYPGEDEEVSEAEARRAVEVAGRVRQTVRRSLRLEGLELPEDSE
ncbi:MAG: HEPN domain-containing protein [Terriglobia bacterium]